jgi:hypothetical protein
MSTGFRIQDLGFRPLYRALLLASGFLLLTSVLHAAWGTGGGTCTAQSKSAGTSLSCTIATENFDAGNVAVLWFSGDNTASSDGNDGLLSSVTDSASNSWTVGRCFTNGQGGAGSGATTCVAYSKLTTQLTSGSSTITANFSSITAKAIVTKEFTIGSGNVVSVAGTPQDVANDAADPGSLTISSLTSGQYLFVRGTGLERASGGTWTVTTNYTSSGCNGTTGSGAATNMEACGEFRIFTGTGDTSNPTGTAVDCASTYIALQEAAPPSGMPRRIIYITQAAPPEGDLPTPSGPSTGNPPAADRAGMACRQRDSEEHTSARQLAG